MLASYLLCLLFASYRRQFLLLFCFYFVLFIIITHDLYPLPTPTHFQVVSASKFTKPLESGGKKIGSSTITVSTTLSYMSPSKHCHLSCRFERRSCLRTIQKLTSSSQQLVWIRRYEYSYIFLISVIRFSCCNAAKTNSFLSNG